MSIDVIDHLAGITPGSELDLIRGHRQQARQNAQQSFRVLVEPAEPGTFTLTERAAVALFTATVHAFGTAEGFYAGRLEALSPRLVAPVRAAAASAATTGPRGVYREAGLAAESDPVAAWTASEEVRAELGDRLTAALHHAQLLVFRPRESDPEALRALADAGWNADEIVSLSQLVSFLAFQLRTAWGLRALRHELDGNPLTASPLSGQQQQPATSNGAAS